ncbi:MAG: exodeoxyribonuclease VII small subunit [Alteromonadaceae bacterium]|nr:MAG: exodeoxyribonuclease VII small subunit [Alteromonadaceae bacterium]
MAAKKTALNFEKSLAELESIVTILENGDLNLEDSLKTFEQGIKLTQNCQGALNDAEQRVQILLNKDGQLETQDFDPHSGSA